MMTDEASFADRFMVASGAVVFFHCLGSIVGVPYLWPPIVVGAVVGTYVAMHMGS